MICLVVLAVGVPAILWLVDKWCEAEIRRTFEHAELSREIDGLVAEAELLDELPELPVSEAEARAVYLANRMAGAGCALKGEDWDVLVGLCAARPQG